MNRKRRLTGASAAAITWAVAAIASPASAQGAPTGAGEQSQAESSTLTEIVVTAQRRAERLQDVPIAVTAMTAETIAKVGVTSTADLASVIPGLTINPTGARSPIFLRGVGNNGTSTSPSVLAFIDGVYQPFDQTGADFSNVQSVEVLKGPQGTLFGRNATGGVIQITTKNPMSWQGVDAQVGYANYDQFSTKVYAAHKFSEMFAADIAGFYDKQADGWGKNVATGNDIYRSTRYGLRSKVVAELSDDFTATFTSDFTYRWGSQGLGISPSTFNRVLFNAVAGANFTLPKLYDVSSEFDPSYKSREGGAALTLEKHVGDIKLLSITSYRMSSEWIDIDFDGTAFPAIHLRRHDDRRAFTQEFQASGGGPKFNWVAGLYYYNMRDGINGPRFEGIFFPGGFAIHSVDHDKAYAAYTQGTYEILPDTRLTLGARYTLEKRDIEGYTSAAGFEIPGSRGKEKETFKKPNFRVALDHRFTPDMLGYVSWTRGFNAGFFNQISFEGFTEAANPVIEPETIDAYEIGMKNEFFDHRLRINVAAFLYDYANLQQQIYSPGGIIAINAAKAKIKGIDVDITARPIKNLTLSLSGNYLDGEYDSYPLAPNYVFLPSGEFAAVGARDAAGNRLVQAPKFGVQASATYTLQSSFGDFDSTVNVNYQSKQYADPQNNYPIRGRTLIGLTEQWTSLDGNTTVTAWVKNLTNKHYDLSFSLLKPVGLVGNPAAPRTFGVTVGRKF